MKELLARLAKARQLEDLCKKAKQDAVAEFEASPYFQTLQVNYAEALAKTNELTEQVKSDGIAVYEVDKEKKPEHGGFDVGEYDEVELKELDELREWCFLNNRTAFKLDTKSIEKDAIAKKIPAKFAVVKKVPKVRIKSDLSGFLE